MKRVYLAVFCLMVSLASAAVRLGDVQWKNVTVVEPGDLVPFATTTNLTVAVSNVNAKVDAARVSASNAQDKADAALPAASTNGWETGSHGTFATTQDVATALSGIAIGPTTKVYSSNGVDWIEGDKGVWKIIETGRWVVTCPTDLTMNSSVIQTAGVFVAVGDYPLLWDGDTLYLNFVGLSEPSGPINRTGGNPSFWCWDYYHWYENVAQSEKHFTMFPQDTEGENAEGEIHFDFIYSYTTSRVDTVATEGFVARAMSNAPPQTLTSTDGILRWDSGFSKWFRIVLTNGYELYFEANP
jgi:hypothetical protein